MAQLAGGMVAASQRPWSVVAGLAAVKAATAAASGWPVAGSGRRASSPSTRACGVGAPKIGAEMLAVS